MVMERKQEIGRYMRLQQELIDAYTAPSCQPGLIERLTDQLASIRQSVKRYGPGDEQSSESMPGMLEVDVRLD